jgi:hypothetical protein
MVTLLETTDYPELPPMSEVTRFLNAIEAGDPNAAAQLWPLVYDELRNLAAAQMVAERPDHTLNPTALVHEAYLRLIGPHTGRSLCQQPAFLRRGQTKPRNPPES